LRGEVEFAFDLLLIGDDPIDLLKVSVLLRPDLDWLMIAMFTVFENFWSFIYGVGLLVSDSTSGSSLSEQDCSM